MANITLTVPDAALPRVQAALQDRNQSAKEFLTDSLVMLVRAYEENKQRADAIAALPPVGNLPVT